jgi:hypothetical protein
VNDQLEVAVAEAQALFDKLKQSWR